MSSKPLRPPFPYFGGKSAVSDLVWERFGEVNNYIEPFFGGGAVLLQSPYIPTWETVNDIDSYIVNFWRAVKADPAGVAEWADKPVHEIELHAVNKWIMEEVEGCTERLREDIDYYNVKLAGLWVWGICCWIGGGWGKTTSIRRPHLKRSQGVVAISRTMPRVGGRGIVKNVRNNTLLYYMEELQARLKNVRVICGDWKRACTDSTTIHVSKVSAIFLDPPYDDSRSDGLYNHDSFDVYREVAEWAIAKGDDPRYRIAYCGYEGSTTFPDSWEVVEWKTQGGYSNQSKIGKNENRTRERIWFSPHCIKPLRQLEMFEALGQ